MAAGAISLIKSHDIVILSFCNIVKGQARYLKTVLISKKVSSHPFMKTVLVEDS